MMKTKSHKVVKYVDDLNNTNPAANTLLYLAQPGQGVAVNAFTGDKYVIDKIDFYFSFEANTLATCIQQTVRLIIYQVVQPVAPAAPASPLANADILQDYQAGTQTRNVVSPTNYATTTGKMIHILRDDVFVLNPFDRGSYFRKFTVRPKIKTITYDSTNLVWERGSIFVYLINSVGSFGLANTHNSLWSARTWFNDFD